MPGSLFTGIRSISVISRIGGVNFWHTSRMTVFIVHCPTRIDPLLPTGHLISLSPASTDSHNWCRPGSAATTRQLNKPVNNPHTAPLAAPISEPRPAEPEIAPPTAPLAAPTPAPTPGTLRHTFRPCRCLPRHRPIQPLLYMLQCPAPPPLSPPIANVRSDTGPVWLLSRHSPVSRPQAPQARTTFIVIDCPLRHQTTS